jgi:hypothetical protein
MGTYTVVDHGLSYPMGPAGCGTVVDSGVVVHESVGSVITETPATSPPPADSRDTVAAPEQTDVTPRDLPAGLDGDATSVAAEPSPVDSNQASATEPMEEPVLPEDSGLDFLDDTTPSEPAVTDEADELFPAEEPAQPTPTQPMPEEPALDSLFPADDQAAEPATEVDDLFPLEEMPAQPAAETTEDSLFSEPEPAADELFPAEEPAAEEPATEDLFPADSDDASALDLEAPALDAAPPADDDFDSLFDAEPEAAPEPADTESENGGDLFDDLFEGASSAFTLKTDLLAKAGRAAIRGSSSVVARLSNLGAFVAVIEAGADTDKDQAVVQAVREWTDNTGLYRTQGKLVAIGDDHVRLRKTNGRLSTVPMRRLSKADQQFVRQAAERLGR